MDPPESSKRKASEITPESTVIKPVWWPNKAELEPVPDFMTSNALFFVLWESLGTGSSLSFKFRTDIDEPSLTASVFVVSEYNFFLEKGEDGSDGLAKNKTADHNEAQQRLQRLVENGQVTSVTISHPDGDYTRESTRREEGGWTLFKLKDD